ncbi:MAG: class B sortase [Clostridia bacterium]|nr:class B sortase [Clostridia bacterium]
MENNSNKGYGVIEENQPEKSKKSKSTLVAVLLLVAAILCCLGYIGVLLFQHFTAQQSYGEIEDIAMITPQSNEQATKVDPGDVAVGKSPIDLPALQEINSDVYAWIRIPGTYVDYPVAQSKVDDNYYLHRSIYKKYLFAGMIYTQSCNALDFSDPVTVVYGHNMRSTTMFTSLHYFEDPEFFDTHDVFYIYTADRVLTYHIVSAYKYDNRHIMNAFDFSDPEVLADYQEYVLNPVSTLRNVRKGVTLDENSKLVVLSTCMSNDKSSRFLVNGVLVSDVPIEQ